MIKPTLVTISALLCFSNCTQPKQDNATIKIAFGSCGDQHYPQPVLDLAVNQNPDAFIYLGDNIYSDTYEMALNNYDFCSTWYFAWPTPAQNCQ